MRYQIEDHISREEYTKALWIAANKMYPTSPYEAFNWIKSTPPNELLTAARKQILYQGRANLFYTKMPPHETKEAFIEIMNKFSHLTELQDG